MCNSNFHKGLELIESVFDINQRTIETELCSTIHQKPETTYDYCRS